MKLELKKYWAFACLLLPFVFASNLIACSSSFAADLLSEFSHEERSWIEHSCPRSLGPSLYSSCVQRESSALRSGIPDISRLPSDYQAWIRQSCPTSLGPNLYISCVQRETSALRSGPPDLNRLDPENRAWIEQSCPRTLGPSLYLSCIQRELGALGLTTSPRVPEIRTPRARPAPSQPTRVVSPPSFKWPDWEGQHPPMPADTSREELSPIEIFRVNSSSVYVVVAGTNRDTIAKATDEAALGSAVAVSQRHLITNCHIFEDRPVILVKQGDKFDQARLLYAQPGTDRCYLETESLRLVPVRGVRRYNDLTVGEHVYSIGAPAGLENTLGEGLISGLRKGKDIRLIQTSAPISPGSSGGGLFDDRGNLIGITTLFLQEAQNLNFAIVAEDFWK